ALMAAPALPPPSTMSRLAPWSAAVIPRAGLANACRTRSSDRTAATAASQMARACSRNAVPLTSAPQKTADLITLRRRQAPRIVGRTFLSDQDGQECPSYDSERTFTDRETFRA